MTKLRMAINKGVAKTCAKLVGFSNKQVGYFGEKLVNDIKNDFSEKKFKRKYYWKQERFWLRVGLAADALAQTASEENF